MYLTAFVKPVALAAAIGLSLGYALPSSATIVFADNFEDTTVVPGLPDAPQFGSYPTAAAIDPESPVVVAGGSKPASPGSGSNILEVAGKSRNYGDFTTAATAANSDIVNYSLDSRLDASSDNNFALLGNSTGGIALDTYQATIWIRTASDGNIYAYDGGWQDTGLDHVVGEWQTYSIAYAVGASSYTLTAGTNSAALTHFTGTVATEVSAVAFGQGGTNSTLGYVDNVSVEVVPEPATVVLTGLGLLTMTARRRRSM